MNRTALPLLLTIALLCACGDDEPAPASDSQPAAPVTASPDSGVPAVIGDSLAAADTTGAATPAAPGAGEPGRSGTPLDARAGARDASDRAGTGGAANRDRAATTGGVDAGIGTPRYTAQIGAFLEPGTARSLMARLERQGVPVWTTNAVVAGREYHRVRIGAAETMEEARALRERIRRSYSWPVWIAPLGRAELEEVPPEAVGATRVWVGG